jgi:hypothetical protein
MSRDTIGKVSGSFRQPWTQNPGTGARAALGKWLTTSVRHLAAITVLAEEHDLSTVAEVHYRQMLEISLQVRRFVTATASEQEELAERISAWGCLDFLEKLEPAKELALASKGYQEMTVQLSKYDPGLIARIRSERKNQMH